jgi:hypothetical protein
MMPAAMVKPHAVERRGGALELHRKATNGGVSIFGGPQQTVENTAALAPIRSVALNYLTIGGGPHLPRGGARNSASRESHALRTHQVANLRAAAEHADRIGLPFNRMVTIHWEAAGVALPKMAKATGRFLDLMTKAIARHGGATAWAWVHEGGVSKGGHCHLLTHVPPHLVAMVTRLQKGWLKRITVKPYRARVIHSRPIGGRLGLEVGKDTRKYN